MIIASVTGNVINYKVKIEWGREWDKGKLRKVQHHGTFGGKKTARLGGGSLGICDVVDTWENHIALGKGVSELYNDLEHSN